MIAYLDNSATTRCFDEVRDLMSEIMDIYYGNPSSMHMVGVEAEKYIRYASDVFAKNLKVNAKGGIFHGMQGTFRACMQVLLSFHISDKEVS